MLHYTACGLDNVWLENGYREVKTAYGKGVAIQDADGLHDLLASNLVSKKSRLTGKEFRFLRVQLGLTQGALAKLQGVTEQSVSLWERTGKVPHANDALARLCYMAHAHGDITLKSAIETVKAVDKMVNRRIVANKAKAKWSTRSVTTEPRELAAA